MPGINELNDYKNVIKRVHIPFNILYIYKHANIRIHAYKLILHG